MLKKALCSLGFGGATVDTVLERPEAMIGDVLRPEVRIKGGEIEQDIRSIALELVTSCRVEVQENVTEHGEIVVASAMIEPGRIGAHEERTIRVELAIPLCTPITGHSTKTELRTRLEVLGGIDPQDSDRIEIRPNQLMAALLNGIKEAGFLLADTEVEHTPQGANPVTQEFDFRPTSPEEVGVEEIEVSFIPINGGLEVHLTVDNRGGFTTRGTERSARFEVTEADIAELDVARALRTAIEAARAE